MEDDVMGCSECGRGAGMGHSMHCSQGYEAELRGLLVEWQRFALALTEADVIAYPERLMGKTAGLLDATAV